MLYFTDWHTWALQVQLFFPTSSSSPPYPPLPRLQKLHNEKRVKKKTEEETDGRRRLLLFSLSHNRRFWHQPTDDYDEHKEEIGRGI